MSKKGIWLDEEEWDKIQEKIDDFDELVNAEAIIVTRVNFGGRSFSSYRTNSKKKFMKQQVKLLKERDKYQGKFYTTIALSVIIGIIAAVAISILVFK